MGIFPMKITGKTVLFSNKVWIIVFMDKHERESKMNTKAIKVAKKAGKNLGNLNKMALSVHAPTLLAFFENGVVAVALDTFKICITKY